MLRRTGEQRARIEGRNKMKRTLIAALLLAFGSFCSLAADAFRADADATGTVVLWFLGQDVTADVLADVTLSGTLLLDGVATPFTVSGHATGSGTGNLNTLAVDAMIVFTAEGKTESGTALTIQGGISVDGLDAATTSSTSVQGRGRFYFLITTTGGRWTAEGDAAGSASGSFVVPNDPLSMQMAGAGAFALSGEIRRWSPSAGAVYPEWPAKLLAEIERQSASGEDAPGK
jgi:hypothetical protein